MISVSKHAEKRLKQRRKVKHLQRHINKMQKWGFGSDGIFIHKGWRYVIRDNCLITVYGGRELREYLKQARSVKND
jgi:hypothetical protein